MFPIFNVLTVAAQWLIKVNLYRSFTIFIAIQVSGRYRYSLTLNPDQPVKRLRIDVFIEENVPFQFVTVPPFKTDQTYKIGEGEPPGTSVTIR